MARTLPPVTQAFLLEQSALVRFRRALRRDDQRILDDLLDIMQENLSISGDGPAAYDLPMVHTLPFEMFLLYLLLAEGEEVLRLRQEIDSHSDTAQEAAVWLFPARTPQDG
jgi:hypothetical protein